MLERTEKFPWRTRKSSVDESLLLIRVALFIIIRLIEVVLRKMLYLDLKRIVFPVDSNERSSIRFTYSSQPARLYSIGTRKTGQAAFVQFFSQCWLSSFISVDFDIAIPKVQSLTQRLLQSRQIRNSFPLHSGPSCFYGQVLNYQVVFHYQLWWWCHFVISGNVKQFRTIRRLL